MLALRLQTVIKTIIAPDETGYIKGRYIGENLKMVIDLIDFLKIKNNPGMLLQLDFEKVFDSVSWNFLHETLKKFGFGDTFRKWIKILYNNSECCVTNNGYHSNFFSITRGIRQGCPISALLFIIVVEVMAINIRLNNEIKGIRVDKKVIKISQLADDTTLLLEDLDSVKIVIDLLSDFSKISGLKLNTSKTEAVWLGRNIGRTDRPLGLHWNNDFFKCLGIWCHTNTESMIDKNYRERIDKLRNVLNIWHQRRLSLKGKITVLWSIALPQVLYVTSILYTPKWVTDEISDILFKFLWSNKKHHVKKETIIANVSHGGLRMVHFESMQKAIKLNWVKRFCSMTSNCAILANYKSGFPLPLSNVFTCKLVEEHISCKCLFYQQILQCWFEIVCSPVLTARDIYAEPLWLNSNILIDMQPAFYRRWWESRIRYVCDICNSDGSIMTRQELEGTFKINISCMEYNGIVSAIPRKWRQTIQGQSICFRNDDIYVNINGHKKVLYELRCKDYYNFFIGIIAKLPTAVAKWNETYNIDEQEWEIIFGLPFKITIETDLQSFQYKILNRFLPCNYTLSIWYSTISKICPHCCTEVDTLVHYFVYCNDVVIFWKQFEKMWRRIFHIWFPLIERDIIFGIQNESNDVVISTLNYCILLGKYYIYCTKRNEEKIFFFNYVYMLKNKLEVFKMIHTIKGKSEEFNLKWSVLYDNL